MFDACKRYVIPQASNKVSNDKTGGDSTFEIQASNTLPNAETEVHPQSITTIFEGPICDDQLSTTRENCLPNERIIPITNLCKKWKVDMETNTRSEKHLKKRLQLKKRYKTNTHSSTKYVPLNWIGMNRYSNMVKGGLLNR